MKTKLISILLCSAALCLAACSQETDQQAATEQSATQTSEKAGTAEQVGKQIDKAVADMQTKAREAESRLGEKLIEAGKTLQEKEATTPVQEQ